MSRGTSDLPKFYWGTAVTPRLIRAYARQIAERFQPDKIILFGSAARGEMRADSDIDVLVLGNFVVRKEEMGGKWDPAWKGALGE